jgi:hypothetical protein
MLVHQSRSSKMKPHRSSSDTGLPDDALLVSVLELWRGALFARFTLDRYWLDWMEPIKS